eukprot:6459705-Amphidinium_carterae.1
MLAAVQHNYLVLQHAAEGLLLDSTFARKEKKRWYILKVSLLSGRSTAVISSGTCSAEDFIRDCCCSRLGITSSGTEALVHGTE